MVKSTFPGDVILTELPNESSLATDSTGKIIAGSGGGSQTPWASNINGANYSLSNVLEADVWNLGINQYVPQSVSTTVDTTGNYSADRVSGATSVFGHLDRAIHLSDAGSLIAVDTITGFPTGNSPWAISTWVRLDAPSATVGASLASYGNLGSSGLWAWINTFGGNYITVSGNNPIQTATAYQSNLIVNDALWHNIVISYDGSYLYFFLDNVAGSAPVAVPGGFSFALTDPLCIGSFLGNYPTSMDMEDFRFYSADITASGTDTSVISAIWNSGNGTFSESGSLGTNLLAHYLMQDGVAPIVTPQYITQDTNFNLDFSAPLFVNGGATLNGALTLQWLGGYTPPYGYNSLWTDGSDNLNLTAWDTTNQIIAYQSWVSGQGFISSIYVDGTTITGDGISIPLSATAQNPFNQSLNTTDSPEFAGFTVSQGGGTGEIFVDSSGNVWFDFTATTTGAGANIAMTPPDSGHQYVIAANSPLGYWSGALVFYDQTRAGSDPPLSIMPNGEILMGIWPGAADGTSALQVNGDIKNSDTTGATGIVLYDTTLSQYVRYTSVAGAMVGTPI